MDYSKESIELHKKYRGKLAVVSKVPIQTKDDLSTAYTPGVAEPCRQIAANTEAVYDLTIKGGTVAVVTDGSAVLGLGNIGPEAALPVMEGKAVLFKEMAGVDAFPICLRTQDVDEIVETIVRIEPVFGGINLEDISAPRCFEIEKRLADRLSIPVFHDDQHGTAIVVLAGLINALKVAGKALPERRIVISGAGAAGTAVSHLLLSAGVKDLVVLDSKGVIEKNRADLNPPKQALAEISNSRGITGGLSDALKDADVFIGVSKPDIVNAEMISGMADNPIIFALSNPIPEISREAAIGAGASVYACGRSDDPNQINNVLVFPGIFKGALAARAKILSPELHIKIANAISAMVPEPSTEHLLPSALDRTVADTVAKTVVAYFGNN
ncbi:NADP-dependent malic enzyme [Patescibacteria group bacterium]|nr:NADP-dependent malic enzyme [Patescibacteria group bacterium]